MSRLTEYLPETGIVFEDEEDNEYNKAIQAILARGGGNTGGGAKPAEKPYYEARREENLQLGGFKRLEELAADPSAKYFGPNQIRLGDGSVYNYQAGENTWKSGNNWFTNNKQEVSAYQNAPPVSGGAPGTAGGTAGAGGTTPGVLPGVRGGVAGVSPEARQFGPANATSLPNSAGVNIPGWDAFRQPGIGIPNVEGRQQLYDNNGLNTMTAGRQGSATQFPTAPGMRGPGQTGAIINFAGSAAGSNSQLASTLQPQNLFGPAEANVPGSYVKGEGNVGDANRAYALPFNIGPGGAALANVAGNNVQVNGPPGSGVGYGFALGAMPASNPFALTGRNASEDPALQTIQTLMLNSAIAQGRMGDIMATNPNQFGGNPAGTGNGPWSGNGGMGQGNFWGGYTPDPVGATPGAGAGGAGGGGGLPSGYQGSAQSLFQNGGAGYMGGYGGGAGGGANPGRAGNAGVPSAAASLIAQGGAGYMGAGNPLLGNVQQSLGAGLPPPTAAPAGTLLSQLQAQREEEERGGGEGGRTAVPYSRGGTVTAGLPGFATGGKLTTVASGGEGESFTPYNPTGAAAPIDAALGGSLASDGGWAAAPGGAVNTTPTQSTNPAESAIQPVQAPQNNVAITPPATAPVATAPPVAAPTVPAPAPAPPVAMPPAQTPVPQWKTNPQTGLDLGVLNQFNQSVAKQAQQQRLRETYSNRWQAANLAGPTAIQLQPGQEMPTEGLPPGAYYDISEALKSLMGDIKGSQTELAGLGEIGDPEQIMAYLSGLEVEQAPYQKAQDIKLQLAGLGQGAQGDPYALMQQQEALKQQMGPLGTILDAQQKRTALGDRTDAQSYASQIVYAQEQVEAAEQAEQMLAQLAAAEEKARGTPQWDEALMDLIGASQNLSAAAATGEQWKTQLYELRNQMGQAEGRNNAIDEAERTVANLLAKAGLTSDQAAGQLGTYGAQLDALKQAYGSAMQGETYRQQMAALIGNKDPTAELGRIGALIGQTKTNYGNVEKARQLNNRITNLAQRGAKLPGFAGGGDMTTEEPIIGVGMFSGRPRFQVGEPQYAGGPPMAERLTITPLNRPAALPMGRMSRAA